MNTICAEDGIDDKRTPEQNSSECTDKADNTETNRHYQNTYQPLIWRLQQIRYLCKIKIAKH